MPTPKPSRLLVMASTFPRWKGDATAPFVKQFCEYLTAVFSEVFVLAPHSAWAKTHETIKGVYIKRFHYFYPARGQNIAYDGGAVAKSSIC